MKEKVLTGKLVKSLKQTVPGSVVYKHADRVTSGVPDISWTCLGKTMWIETKYIITSLHSQGLQAEMLNRLGAQGLAVYVVFDEIVNQAFIVEPRYLESYREHYIWRTATLSTSHVATYLHRIMQEGIRPL